MAIAQSRRLSKCKPMQVKLTRMLLLGWMVGICLAAIGGVFNAMGMNSAHGIAMAILLLAATLWISEAIPLFATSLGVLFLALTWLSPMLKLLGQPVDDARFLTPFFSDIILLFLGGFVMSAGLHKLQIDQWLARRIMVYAGTSIPRLVFGIMLVTAGLSMWLSNTATAAMMLALVIPITQLLPSDDRYRQALLLSIPFSANIGGLGTPIGSPPNAIAMQYLKQAELEPSFAQWMMIGIPGTICMLIIAWLLLLGLYRGRSARIDVLPSAVPLAKSVRLYVVLLVTLVTVVGWMTTGIHGYSTGTVALFPVVFLFGTRILDVKDLRGLSWDVLLLMGGGLCLGEVISVSGLATWIVDLLPVSGLSLFQMLVAFGGIACIMSSVMSNTATANLVMPILLGLQIESLSPLLIGVAFACSLAMPLPVSTPPNAMAFSSGEISVADMVRPGLVITLLGVALAFTAGYWWWGVVGLY